jgi:hypothetical protein
MKESEGNEKAQTRAPTGAGENLQIVIQALFSLPNINAFTSVVSIWKRKTRNYSYTYMIRLINCLKARTGRVQHFQLSQILGSACLAVQYNNIVGGARVLVCQHQCTFSTKGSLLTVHLLLLHRQFSSNRASPASKFSSTKKCFSHDLQDFMNTGN